MLSVTHTSFGTKISYISDKPVQNSIHLKEIWKKPSEYYKFVDNDEIISNNKILEQMMIDFDFNKILLDLDPKKTLSHVSDCTKKDCLFDRYKYSTRDKIYDFLIKNVDEQNLSSFNILFINSFQLLNELFYLSELIRTGYTITEIHLLDQTYCNFMLSIGSMEIISEDFLIANKLGWVFYQFLEYFFINEYPIDIYVHGNQLKFSDENINRIDITIGVDVDTSVMDDILTNIAICMVNKSNTLNIMTNVTNKNMFGILHKQLTIYSYVPYKIYEENLPIIFNNLKNIMNKDVLNCANLTILNSLLNTILYENFEVFQKTRILKKIMYNNYIALSYYIFLLIFILTTTIIIINRNKINKSVFWILLIFTIIFIIYCLHIIMHYQPIYFLRI